MRFSLARALPLILAAGALPLAAQTTGTLQGRVLDNKGGPIQGTIVAISVAIGDEVRQGQQVA